MKKRTLLLAPAALAVLFLAGWKTQSPSKPQWEYKTIILFLNEEKLNKLGAEGWELVTLHDYRGPSGEIITHYYFKRPR